MLRPSGTEPVVRIMMECETEALCDMYIDRLYQIIVSGGYCSE